MKELKEPKRVSFTIKLAPVSKKNHSQIITNPKTGRPMLIPSKQYREYEQNAAWFIPRLSEPISEPVNVRGIFYMPTKRKCDLVNMEQALCDLLVKSRVIEDDNYTIVQSMDGSRVEYDKENPRTEVIIEYLGGDEYE